MERNAMKRLLIIGLVLAAHAFFIYYLFQPETPANTDNREQKNPQQPVQDDGTGENGTQIQNDAGSDTPPPPPPPKMAKLDIQSFTVAETNLPDNIAAAAKASGTGLLLDWDAQTVLWQKNPGKPVPIASLTKMMTALLVVEAIADTPSLSYATQVKVTRNASNIGGSQVYLDPRETLTVDELLKCVMIFSANDAAYLLAEFFGQGNVDMFVERINKRANEMGLMTARFLNPHGLDGDTPETTNHASAWELAFIAGQLLEYPHVVKWSSTWMSSIRGDDPRFNEFQLVNRNRLVNTVPGVNGMKTGYTKDAGWCIVATCERNNRRIICVLTGCPDKKSRNTLAELLIDWAYLQHP
jgi:D-alanyl-D-alanine carboxypeptidase (penicillin-binding protein 5/6)